MDTFGTSETWWERKAKETSRGIDIDFISNQLVQNLKFNMFSTDFVSGLSSGETSGPGSPQLINDFAKLSLNDSQRLNDWEFERNGREVPVAPRAWCATDGFGRVQEVSCSNRRPMAPPIAAYPSVIAGLGRERPSVAVDSFCSLCKNNGEAIEWYMSHTLKDSRGKVSCPVLRTYNCPKCHNRGGDMAHTLRYCPLNETPSSTPLAKMLRTTRTSSGRRRAATASGQTQLKF